MNDYLAAIPAILASTAQRLDGVFDVPWPLWVGGLFPLYLGVLYFILWFRRGSSWPVRCIYPVTARGRGRDCRNHVPGEWYRCRYHNWLARYRHHDVDTSIQRWQTVDRRGAKVDRPAKGMGFLRATPARETLLYHNGFARPPFEVLKLLPLSLVAIVRRLLSMRLRTPASVDQTQERHEETHGFEVAEGMATVVPATQFTLGAFLVALLGTGVSVLLNAYPTPKAIVQWVAVLGFVLAWAAISRGVYHRRPDWLSSTCLVTAKWWATLFVPVAAATLLFGS